MKNRLLALILTLALLIPAPALAASDLAEAFAAAGIALPDYSDSIDSLSGEIRAAYGSARDAQGRFRPGAMIVALANSGGQFNPHAANPYLMPTDPDEKLAFMLAEGLMQYALQGRLTAYTPDADPTSWTFDASMDAGLDNDKCLVVDGNLDVSSTFQSGPDRSDSDGFYLRYNQETNATRVKPPFADELVTEEQDAALPEPARIIKQSFQDDAAAWADAIDLLYVHLAAQPELMPVLSWLCEGAAMPDHWSLDQSQLVPILRRLMTALGTDARFTEALSKTKLLEAIDAGTGESHIALKSLTQGMRGAAIALGLCTVANSLVVANDPFANMEFAARLDLGALRLSARTGTHPDYPPQFDQTFELILRHGENGRLLQANWGDPYDAYTLNISADNGRCDAALQYGSRNSGASLGVARLSIAKDRLHLTFLDPTNSAPLMAELDLRRKDSGAWRLTGYASEGDQQLYSLEGAGDLSSGSAKGTGTGDALLMPDWLLEYRDDGTTFTASASMLQGGQNMGLPMTLSVTRHEDGFDAQAGLLGMTANLSCSASEKDAQMQLSAMSWLGPISLSFSSTESDTGARDTEASALISPLTAQPITARLHTQPVSDGEYQYDITLDAPNTKLRVDGLDHLEKDLSLPVPLALDQQGTYSLQIDGQTITGEYDLHHKFEVKERKHRDPALSAPAEEEPLPADLPEGTMSAFAPAETEPVAEPAVAEPAETEPADEAAFVAAEEAPLATLRPVHSVK